MSKAEQRRRSRRSYANPKRSSKDKAFHEKTVLGETILSKKNKNRLPSWEERYGRTDNFEESLAEHHERIKKDALRDPACWW